MTTGRVRQKAGERGARRYLVDAWRAETLPVNAFLVEHPDGICLIDAGQTAAAAEPGYFARWYPFFRLSRFELSPEDEAGAQLVAAGIEPASVRWVVLTHLHTDHVGGLGPFRDAEVVVSRLEWTRAQGAGGRLRGYIPQRWPAGLQPMLVDLDGPGFGPFGGTHDLAGDGRIVLVPLPGHTAGHIGVLVRSDERTYLCIGDAAHRASELTKAAPAVAEWCACEGVVVLACHDDAPDLPLRGA